MTREKNIKFSFGFLSFDNYHQHHFLLDIVILKQWNESFKSATRMADKISLK